MRKAVLTFLAVAIIHFMAMLTGALYGASNPERINKEFESAFNSIDKLLTSASRERTAEAVGVPYGTFYFPESKDVFDPQWAGHSIELIKCDKNVSNDQKVYVSIQGNTLGVYYNTKAPNWSRCWQAAEQTDPIMMARMANWMDRSARVSGYAIQDKP